MQTTIDDEPLSLINIHLIASSTDGRISQARTLRSWIEDLGVETSNIIVLGDFNSRVRFNQTSSEKEVGIIRGFATPEEDDNLFDTQQDLVDRSTHVGDDPFDRIMLSPFLKDNPALVYTTVETRRDLAVRGRRDRGREVDYDKSVEEQDLSDHYPVVVRFSY